MSGTLTVHLRVNDAPTGRPTPVRLRVAGPRGEPFAPLGRFPLFPIGRGEDVGGHVLIGRDQRHCHVDGSCEIRLPTGVPLLFEATKGPEYIPLRETVTLGAGQMTLRFTMQRWTNQREEGWYSGDGRCHFLTPHDALLEAAAEDLAVVNLLATVSDVPGQDGRLYHSAANLTAFSGQQPALESPGHLVAVNTFNTHPVLGRVALLHAHRPVFPLTFGGADDTDDWSVCDWCDQCHRKRGLTVWADPFRARCGLAGGEALIALLLGKIDALEVDPRERAAPLLPAWYRLLDGGFRVPLLGCSAKENNRTALGSVRTYSHLEPDQPLSFTRWVEAVRLGRSFVTNGPLLRFTVNGQLPGVLLSATDEPLRIEASAKSGTPYERLEVVANGEVIADATPTASFEPARIELEHRLPEGGWIAVRCRSTRPRTGHVPAFAHANPVYVSGTQNGNARIEAARDWLRGPVIGVRDWVEAEGRFANPRNKEHLLRRAEQALALLGDAPAG